MDNLFEHLGGILKPHAASLAAGSKLTVNKDLSFTPKTLGLTESYRKQLATIALSVDVNMNAILGMITTDQLNQVIEDHKHIEWQHPEGNALNTVKLTGIYKSEGKWWLSFDDSLLAGFDMGSYQLHDMNIEDVLAFMATCENIIMS